MYQYYCCMKESPAVPAALLVVIAFDKFVPIVRCRAINHDSNCRTAAHEMKKKIAEFERFAFAIFIFTCHRRILCASRCFFVNLVWLHCDDHDRSLHGRCLKVCVDVLHVFVI